MYKIDLKIKKYATLSVYTDWINLVNKLLEKDCSIKRTIPITEVTTSETNTISEENAIFIFNDTYNHMEIDKVHNVAYLYSNPDNFRFVDIVYVILSMFSNLLQNTNKYLIHSSVVKYDNNNSIMVVGDANAGKTSMAYKLMQDFNCQLVSNDHALIGVESGKLKVFAGTKDIQMRLGAIKMYFPKLYSDINCIDESNLWERKIVVNKYIDLDQIALTDESFISDIFNISVYQNGDTFLRTREYIDQLLFLYENLSKQIKSTYSLITGFNYPMPSFETQIGLHELNNNCKNMLNSCSVHEGKGTLDALSKEMVKIYGKK